MITDPPPSLAAVSIESTSRVRCSGPTTMRSTTTWMSCFLFLSIGIFSPISYRLPSTRQSSSPAHRSVRHPHPRIEQPKVVLYLGDRAHRRPRFLRRALLVDRDRGRQPLDHVYIRLFHLAEELPRVCRQGLHISPLSFGIDRVEGERRLARPRQAGEHDQLVARD